jgi:hypothetical protein
VRKPDLIRAVVAFYGTGLWLQTEYSVARAAYLGHYAEFDEWEPIDEVQGTQEALRAAGCEVKFYTYPGVGHWFFEEDRADHYNAEASRLAWDRTVEFLRVALVRTSIGEYALFDQSMFPASWGSFRPLFTRVRGSEILGSSPVRRSASWRYSASRILVLSQRP